MLFFKEFINFIIKKLRIAKIYVVVAEEINLMIDKTYKNLTKKSIRGLVKLTKENYESTQV